MQTDSVSKNGLGAIAKFAHRARQAGASDPELDRFTLEALFTTMTNVNFDPERLH